MPWESFVVLSKDNSAQPSFFWNSHFWKHRFKNYFQVQKSWIIFENINFNENCHKDFCLWLPSMSQRNFPFFENLIFEQFWLFLGYLFFENYLSFGIRACGTIMSAFNTAQHKFSFPEKNKMAGYPAQLLFF